MKKAFLALIVLLSACTKDQTPGPAGPIGATGPAGANGTVIYSGTTAPDASQGNNGDFYLDLANHILYGPKSATGWGTGFPMTGATGPAGPAGSQIYAGDGPPASDIGTTGDYYLEKDSAFLYGPKESTGWGTPITLQGNANVEYTPWFYPGNQVVDTVWGTVHNYFDQPVPAISNDIFNNGMVVTFAMLNGYYTDLYGSNQVQQMPVSLTYNGMTDTWSAIITPGNVRIDFVNSQNFYTAGVSSAQEFRCVIVPGGVSIPDNLKGPALLRYLRVPN